MRDGTPWVHLRMCQTCGHIGCCDSSPNRHATAHAHGTDHAIARSFEPGEGWYWCYIDEEILGRNDAAGPSWLSTAESLANADGIQDRPSQNRLIVEVDGHEAQIVYRRVGRELRLIHTEVPEELGGQGLGGKLVRAAVEVAEAGHKTIVPWCPFARKWLLQHPEVAARATIDFDKQQS